MLSKLSFRKKIFLSYVVGFFLFLTLILPFSSQFVRRILKKVMEDRASEQIVVLQSMPNEAALVKGLREQAPLVFFRVSVITDQRKTLYDSHTWKLFKGVTEEEPPVDHPEVLEAFKNGIGYYEGYSKLFHQKFIYMAKSFDFHGKTYVVRLSFPYRYAGEITRDFEIGFIILDSVVLLLFSLMTWTVIHHLTRPIQEIITAIKPYQEGKSPFVPEFRLNLSSASDEFVLLANTLNSLSLRMQDQINSLTKEQNEKEAVLESLIEGVISVNGRMEITYVNNMALKLFGKEKTALLGKHAREIGQYKCLEMLVNCQQTGTLLTDVLHLKSAGKKLYLDVVAAPKKQKEGAILVLQDKSTHYRLIEMRKDFIANVSHELKTPITIISGFAEALHDNPDLARETSLQITEKIVRNCKRMHSLIKDLLALADIEHLSEARLEECNLYELVVKCRELVLDAFPDARIEIISPNGKEIYMTADPSLMEMAVLNLIHNAAKYSTPPAEVSVTLEKKDDHLILQVEDKGIGIPEEDLERIFERFYTVDKARSQKLGGSGLGLSIVQTIIEKHFGKISVKSTVGLGTTFTVELPSEMQKLI